MLSGSRVVGTASKKSVADVPQVFFFFFSAALNN